MAWNIRTSARNEKRIHLKSFIQDACFNGVRESDVNSFCDYHTFKIQQSAVFFNAPTNNHGIVYLIGEKNVGGKDENFEGVTKFSPDE